MLRLFKAFILVFLLFCVPQNTPAASDARPATSQDRDFYSIVIVPTLETIRKAMSPAPEGWAVTGQSIIDPNPPAQITGEPGSLQISYSITYARISDDKEKRVHACADLITQVTGSARLETDQLSLNKTELEKALFTAQKRKEIGRERKIRKELDVLAGRLKAIPAEMEEKILRETDPCIVRDTAVTITIALNESAVEFPQAVPFSRPKAAFALRKEGERIGRTGWREGRSTILYGDWQEVRENAFRAALASKPYWSKPQTIVVTAEGDRNRIEQILRKSNMKAIVELMK